MGAEKSQAVKKTEFLWTPGEGPSADALKRLARHCPKPEETMGEAWFMSENRRIYTELKRADLEKIPHAEMERIFWDITSGPSCFGMEDNWDEWFCFLLWYLLEKESCRCGKNIEYLVSCALVMEEYFTKRPYAQYKTDLRDTLGRAIMGKCFWSEQDDLISDIHRAELWHRGPACSGAISASMFLCLELLEEDQVEDWLQSILLISGMYWRVNILCWLLSAHDLLFAPESFANVDGRLFPSIEWEYDYLLPSARVRVRKWSLELFFEKLREHLDLPRFMIWMEPLFDDQSIASQLNNWSITERYADYVLTGKKY